jgi:hypothetical protein
MKKSRLLVIFLIIAGLLLIPLIAMQFIDEVNWSVADFLVAAVLLVVTGLAIDLVLNKVTDTKLRVILFGIVLAFLVLVWAELAVGIFGSPLAGS